MINRKLVTKKILFGAEGEGQGNWSVFMILGHNIWDGDIPLPYACLRTWKIWWEQILFFFTPNMVESCFCLTCNGLVNNLPVVYLVLKIMS